MEYEVASSRGRRQYQEDRVLAVASQEYGLFAVFDGHRGSQASDFALACFYQRFLHHLSANPATDPALKFQRVLWLTLSDMEMELRARNVIAGTTACVAVVTGDLVVVANVGDSRAVVCGQGARDFVLLTRDHLPCLPEERVRIESAGGKIEVNGRLFGQFEVSRAIGDMDLKRYGMSAEPEFSQWRLKSNNKYLLVASDGVFERLQVEDVCQVVASSKAPASAVVARAVEAGTCDNISVVVVRLHR